MNKRTPLIFVFLLFLAFALFVPTSGLAQENITFSEMQIDIWPEYDQASALIIYRGTLNSDVTLPATLTMRIPAAVGDPFAVAVKESDNNLVYITYTREVQGEWGLITFTTTIPEIQLEFYDELTFDGLQRDYSYVWPADYAVTNVRLLVQEPVGTVSMTTIPQLGTRTTDGQNIVYNSSLIGTLQAGETFDLTVSYEKSSTALTVESLQIQSSPINDETSGRVAVNDVLPWALVIGAVIFIGTGIYWYWATGQNRLPSKNKKPTKRGSRRPVSPELDTDYHEDGVFCHTCGKRAGGADKFCRSCGTQLRKGAK